MATRPSVLGGGLLKGVQELNRGLEAQIAQENAEEELLLAADRIALQERQVKEAERQGRIETALLISDRAPGIFTMGAIASDIPGMFETAKAQGISRETLEALPLSPETFEILADKAKMGLIADTNPNSERWIRALVGGEGWYTAEEAALIASGEVLTAEMKAEQATVYMGLSDEEKAALGGVFHFKNDFGEAFTPAGATILASLQRDAFAARSASGAALEGHRTSMAKSLQDEMARAATLDGVQQGGALFDAQALEIVDLIIKGGDEAEAELWEIVNSGTAPVVREAAFFALTSNLAERGMDTRELVEKFTETQLKFADEPGLLNDMIEVYTRLGVFNATDGSIRPTGGGWVSGPGIGITMNPTQSGAPDPVGHVTPAEEERVTGARPATDGPEIVPFDQLTAEDQDAVVAINAEAIKAMPADQRRRLAARPGGEDLIQRALDFEPSEINPNVDVERFSHTQPPAPAPTDTTTTPPPPDTVPTEAAPDSTTVAQSEGEVRSELLAEDLAAIPPRGNDRQGFIKNKTDVFTSAVASVAPLSGMILKEMTEQSGSLAGITPDTVWRELVARLGTPGTSSDRRAAGTKFTAAIRGLATKIGRTSDPTRLQKAFEEAVQDIREAEVALNSIREG